MTETGSLGVVDGSLIASEMNLKVLLYARRGTSVRFILGMSSAAKGQASVLGYV